MGNFKMAFKELRESCCLVVFRSSEQAVSEEITSIGTTETLQRSNRDAVANIATCKPCNVATTFARVAGG